MACAVRMETAASTQVAWETRDERSFWHDRVERTPSGEAPERISALLALMDRAALVCAFNGRGFQFPLALQ